MSSLRLLNTINHSDTIMLECDHFAAIKELNLGTLFRNLIKGKRKAGHFMLEKISFTQ